MKLQKLVDVINAVEEGKIVQRQALTGQWVNINFTYDWTISGLKGLLKGNSLRIKPESYKKEVLVFSQMSISKVKVINYLPRIIVEKEGKYKVTIEEIEE